MPNPSALIRKWLTSVSPDQAREAARSAGTSVAHLRHIGAGRRGMSADLAQRLAHATDLDQRELCEACAKCPLAR
jgi:hypothetical protein